MSDSNSKMQQQILLREQKRKQMQDLFEQKLAVQQQMKTIESRMDDLQNELMQLDSDIETLEEQQHSLPLTMNPEEILPDPGLTLTAMEEDLLTDPRTQTQTQIATQDVLESSQDQHQHPNPARVSMSPVAPLASANFHPLPLQRLEKKKPPKRPRPSNDAECPYSLNQIQSVLRQTFQIPSFRENQLKIIQTTLSGRDCFVIMRTGGTFLTLVCYSYTGLVLVQTTCMHQARATHHSFFVFSRRKKSDVSITSTTRTPQSHIGHFSPPFAHPRPTRSNE